MRQVYSTNAEVVKGLEIYHLAFPNGTVGAICVVALFKRKRGLERLVSTARGSKTK